MTAVSSDVLVSEDAEFVLVDCHFYKVRMPSEEYAKFRVAAPASDKPGRHADVGKTSSIASIARRCLAVIAYAIKTC